MTAGKRNTTSVSTSTRKKSLPKLAIAPDPNGSERRAELLRIAARLFATNGFRSTTVRDIAEEAQILSGSLYHHFDSKETMLDEILRSFLDSLMDMYRASLASSDDPSHQFEGMVRASFQSVVEHRDAIAIYQAEAARLRHIERFAYLQDVSLAIESAWRQLIHRGIAEGHFRRTLDERVIYRFIRDTIWVAARWYRPDGALSADGLADQYLQLLMHGVVEETPRKRAK